MRLVRLSTFVTVLTVVSAGALMAHAAGKTGTIEKTTVDGKKIMVFADTAHGYSLTAPDDWDFKAQKEGSESERNPYRLHMKRKDKQVPTSLSDSPTSAADAQMELFILDVPLTIEQLRDSLSTPQFKAEWQKPIIKYCELLRSSQFLNKYDINWGTWKGVGFAVEQQYQAQVPTGSGLFTSIAEKRLADFMIFNFRGKKMLLYLLSEREFLPENREVAKAMLTQVTP